MVLNVTTHAWIEDRDRDNAVELRQVVVAVVLALFAAFTVAGNTLVMTAVACEPCLRNNVTNYFIMSLAVADLVIGAVVMPFSIVLEASDGWWPFGADWCDLWHSLDVLASTASILNLSVIALDRYWAITDPITYPRRMSTGRAAVFIALVWICSAAISFPAIAWWRHVAAATETLTCAFTDDSAYLILSSTISFYAPVSIILYAYYRIYAAAAAQLRSIERGIKVMTTASYRDGREVTTLRIHRGRRPTTEHDARPTAEMGSRRDALDVPTRRNSSLISDEPSYRRASSASQCDRDRSTRRWKTFTVCRQRLGRVSRERKAAKTLGIVMGVFCACWVPFFVTNLLYGFCRHCVQHADVLFRVFTWLGYINSGMNPVIYACSMRDFRRAFARRLFCSGCCFCPAVHLTAGYNQPSPFASARFVRNGDGSRQDCISASYIHTAN